MMKARSTTGQPQISPQQHPYPHEDVLKCTQCHDPHSPGFGKPKNRSVSVKGSGAEVMNDKAVTAVTNAAKIASNCFGCHGPAGRGGFAPVLAGQPSEVLKEKLTKYKSGEIKNQMMNPVASPLKNEEIEALAYYFAGLS
jgi:cytochrome c553